MHAGDARAALEYMSAAREYGVEKAIALTSLEAARDLREKCGGFFLFCGWPYLFDVGENPRWTDERLREIEEMAAAGFVALKFKIVPDRDGKRPSLWLDDARVKPLLDLAERLGLEAQAHIAQPDAWFARDYKPSRSGRKEEYFAQVERVLEAHPRLTFVGVHMGGWPENLDYLDGLMERFARFHIDTSATKWTVRELSRQHDKAREFFIRRADRILFGSDLVVQRGVVASYYTSRFRVQREMWETSERKRSMIKDPDSAMQPVMDGLGLPAEVLRKVYWENASKMFGIGAPATSRA
jgi:predicted TIM-barrel fold metal-dependent hydrolase